MVMARTAAATYLLTAGFKLMDTEQGRSVPHWRITDPAGRTVSLQETSYHHLREHGWQDLSVCYLGVPEEDGDIWV